VAEKLDWKGLKNGLHHANPFQMLGRKQNNEEIQFPSEVPNITCILQVTPLC
jgi:hypothetical protein